MAYARVALLTFIFLAIGLAKSGCAFGQDTVPVAVPVVDSDKALGPGDTVSYQIIEDNDPPLHKVISDTGDLDVPIIGRVHVSGRTCDEVAAQIRRQLVPKYYRAATVKVAIEQEKIRPPVKVSVTGAVTTVGLVEFPYGEKLTVSEAITKAGGPTQFGDLRKVTLTRRSANGNKETIHIDIKKATGTKDDLELQDGDSIDVGRKLINFGG